MHPQRSLADVEYDGPPRQTRRERFLQRMDALLPWARLEARLRPVYPRGERGRPPYPLALLLRIHGVQLFYNLSDPAVDADGRDAESDDSNQANSNSNREERERQQARDEWKRDQERRDEKEEQQRGQPQARQGRTVLRTGTDHLSNQEKTWKANVPNTSLQGTCYPREARPCKASH